MKFIQNQYVMTNKLRTLEFLPLLALRIYLAPIFIIAGWNKYENFSDVSQWFANTQWGLGLPFSDVMVALVIFAELIGGFALLFGVMTRFFSFSLIVTMIVAILKVHWQHGWFAITPSSPETSIARFYDFFGLPSASYSLSNSEQAAERLQRARELLQEYGNYEWLTESGSFVILNNGIEFATTYLIMLLVLFVFGAGKFVSLDYWLNRHSTKR